MHYRYEAGVYYAPYNGGYRVVPAPVQAVVPSLPAGYETVVVDGTQYLYYGGNFYIPYQDSYQVTAAPPGAVVTNLPEGCEQVQMDNVTYLKYNNTYFQPVSVNNQPAYEVVNIE